MSKNSGAQLRAPCLLAIFLALSATGLMAQTETDLWSAPVLRVADKLHCTCGCTQTMACKMEGDCPICRRGKAKIFAMQQQGKSDQEILASFVQEDGKDILVERPGVMGVGGIAIAAAIGFGIVLLVIRRSLRKPAPAPAGPQMDPETIARIDEDLDKLD